MSDDLWVTASADVEQEDLERRLAGARLAATSVWPVLAKAVSTVDFENRLGLMAERIEHVATNAAGNDPVLFGVVHSALVDGFTQDFAMLHAARIEQRRAARKTADADATSTCSKCGQSIVLEPGVGWVSAESGDDGGTYDICPEGGQHTPGTTSSRKQAADDSWTNLGDATFTRDYGDGVVGQVWYSSNDGGYKWLIDANGTDRVGDEIFDSADKAQIMTDLTAKGTTSSRKRAGRKIADWQYNVAADDFATLFLFSPSTSRYVPFYFPSEVKAAFVAAFPDAVPVSGGLPTGDGDLVLWTSPDAEVAHSRWNDALNGTASRKMAKVWAGTPSIGDYVWQGEWHQVDHIEHLDVPAGGRDPWSIGWDGQVYSHPDASRLWLSDSPDAPTPSGSPLTAARKTADMTVADAPLNTPLVAVDGQYAGYTIVVDKRVVINQASPGWDFTDPGWAVGTVTMEDGSTTYGASFPLDVQVRTASRKRAGTEDGTSDDFNGGRPFGGKIDSGTLQAITQRDPDGQESQPTQADYDDFASWVTSTYGLPTYLLYTSGGEIDSYASRKTADKGDFDGNTSTVYTYNGPSEFYSGLTPGSLVRVTDWSYGAGRVSIVSADGNSASLVVDKSTLTPVTASRKTADANPFAKKDDAATDTTAAPTKDPAPADPAAKDTTTAAWTCPNCGSTDAYTQGGKDLAEALKAGEPIKCGSCGQIDTTGGKGGDAQPAAAPVATPDAPAPTTPDENLKQGARRAASRRPFDRRRTAGAMRSQTSRGFYLYLGDGLDRIMIGAWDATSGEARSVDASGAWNLLGVFLTPDTAQAAIVAATPAVVASRRTAGNPYTPSANPYSTTPGEPLGTPDDTVGGPQNPPGATTTTIGDPVTTRPRQQPSGAPSAYSTQPGRMAPTTQGFASKSMPHLVQEK